MKRALSGKWREDALQLRYKTINKACWKLGFLEADTYEKLAKEYDSQEAPDWLGELLEALGWEDGTVQEAIAAVKRLVKDRK